jgi:hypothetical protein
VVIDACIWTRAYAELFKEGHVISYFPERKAEETVFPKEMTCVYEANDKYQFLITY